MDSVQSLTKFFGKLQENIQTIEKNTKSNEETLDLLFKSEQDEEKGRKKSAQRIKARKDRAARKKKRHKLDVVELLKSTVNKILGGSKKGEWLKKLLIGGALVGAVGLNILLSYLGDFPKRMEELKNNITGVISDFAKKITGQIEEEEGELEGQINEGVKGIEGVTSQVGKNLAPAQDAAETASNLPNPNAGGTAAQEQQHNEEEGAARPDTTPEMGQSPAAPKPGNKTEVRTSDTTEVETQTNRNTTVTNRDSSTTVTETAGDEDDAPGTRSSSSANTRSRRDNRRSSSVSENVSGSRSSSTSSIAPSDTPTPTSPTSGSRSANVNRQPRGGKKPKEAAITGGMMSKAKTIARRLMKDMKISAAAAAGIVGNLMLESGLKPDNVENVKGFRDGPINNIPKGTPRVGYGYGQWTGSRLEKFRQWLKKRKKANKPATDEDNYKFLIHELKGDEPIRNHWKSNTSIPQKDPVKAANWFMSNWERPGKPHKDRRQSYARQVFSAIQRRQKGGGVGIATEHIKKDEALSSLTPGPFPPGQSDWIREGGKSVKTKTDWSAIKPNTTLHSYTDSVGKETIGWGSTYYDNISSGTQPVKKGDTITKKKADEILNTNVKGLNEKYSKEMGTNWSKMSDSQRASLLSMGYNAPNFYSSKTFAPKLKSAIQNGDMKTAADNLEWGGPSPTRVKESQAMLRKGPMDLNKVEVPKAEQPKSKQEKQQQPTQQSKQAKKQGNKQEQKPWWRFGFQQGGFVPYTQGVTSSGTFIESGELNLNKIIDRPNFGSAPQSAPFAQTMGSVGSFGGSQQTMGSAQTRGGMEQTNGNVSAPTSFAQSMGLIGNGSVFSQGNGAAAVQGGMGQTNGNVSAPTSFAQSMGLASNSPAFTQGNGTTAPQGGMEQTNGTPSAPTSFAQSMGLAANSLAFSQGNGTATPQGGMGQTNGTASTPTSFAQSMGLIGNGSVFSQGNGTATPQGGMEQTNGTPSAPTSFAQSMGLAANSPAFAQGNGSAATQESGGQTNGNASTIASSGQKTNAALNLPTDVEVEKMSIQKLNTYLDPSKTGASEPLVFQAARAAKEKARKEGIKEEMEIQRLGQVAAVKAKMQAKRAKVVAKLQQSNGTASTPTSFAQSMGLASNSPAFAQGNGAAAVQGGMGQTNGNVLAPTPFAQSMGLAANSPAFAQGNGTAAVQGGMGQTNGNVLAPTSFTQSMGLAANSPAFAQGNGTATPQGGMEQTDGNVRTPNIFQQALGSVGPIAKFAQSIGRIGSRKGGTRRTAKRYAGAGSRFAQSMGQVGSNGRFSQAMGSIGRMLGSAQNVMRYQQGGSVSGPQGVMGQATTEGGIVPGSGSGDQFPISLPEGSFVLNRKATETMKKLQNGGVTSVSSNTVNNLEKRFFDANEVYSETFHKKKKPPVVIVKGGGSAPVAPPISGGGSGSPATLEGPSGELNMSDIRSRMHRVNAGSLF